MAVEELPADIADRIEKLRVRDGDLIVIRCETRHVPLEKYRAYRAIAEDIHEATGCLVILLPENQDITSLPREVIEQMRYSDEEDE